MLRNLVLLLPNEGYKVADKLFEAIQLKVTICEEGCLFEVWTLRMLCFFFVLKKHQSFKVNSEYQHMWLFLHHCVDCTNKYTVCFFYLINILSPAVLPASFPLS